MSGARSQYHQLDGGHGWRARDLSDATRAFLRGFELIGLTESITSQAVVVRQVHKLKLPDAVIWATAKVHGLKLLTRDTKGFPRQHPDIIVPYEL